MYIMYTMNKPCNTMDTLGTFVENAIKNLHCNINFSYWKCTVLFRQVKKSVKYLYPKYNLKFTPRPREVGRSRTVGTSSFLEGCSLISTFSQVYKSNAENWSGGILSLPFLKWTQTQIFSPNLSHASNRHNLSRESEWKLTKQAMRKCFWHTNKCLNYSMLMKMLTVVSDPIKHLIDAIRLNNDEIV